MPIVAFDGTLGKAATAGTLDGFQRWRLFSFSGSPMASGGATQSVRSACPYCGVGCGLVLDVKDGRVVKVAGDKAHPANAGRLCTKGKTSAEPLQAPGRLTRAQLRHSRGGEQGPVDLEAAIAETAARLNDIIARHGPDAVAFYVSGQMSLEAQYLANKLAKGFIRTRHVESNSRLCMASAGAGYKLSLGSDAPPGSYEDLDAADLFFVIGANMADCHPILFLRMMDRVKAGARLIVVDPRRSATAEKADLFLQIRPGTDLALLNGLLHLLVAEGHVDHDFIAAHTSGWEAMPEFLSAYTPDVVAARTGLAEADIRTAARWIGEAGAFTSLWTMGLNQSVRGTWHTNALCNLHLATGKICSRGSGPFSLTGQPNAMGGREMGYMGPGLPGQRSALVAADRAFTEGLWQIPEGTLRAEAGLGTVGIFEAMAAGEIKACWIICTNPVASVANRDQVVAALKATELVIAQDAFLDTETNIYADILLPAALCAEADGVMVNSERNLTLTRAAVPPPGEALADWELIARIARAMGHGAGFAYSSAAEVFAELTGAHNPATGYDLRGASHARLMEGPLQWPLAPQGTPRNPIRYLNDGRSRPRMVAADGSIPRLAFATPDGRAVFLPRPDLPPAEMPDAEFPFVLNTGRVQHQWHTLTKTGKVPALARLNPGPFLEIHPDDADALHIAEGDRVEVRSRRGRALLPAVVTDRVMTGTCFAPFHWNDVFGDDLAINAVTLDAVDAISLQPAFKFAAVALMRIERAPSQGTGAGRMVGVAAPPLAFELTRSVLKPELLALASLTGAGPVEALELTDDERTYVRGFLAGLNIGGTVRGEAPVLPPSAPFARPKRLLIDGMLAGLFSRTGAGIAPAVEAPVVSVLFASQTGAAEAAAGRCQEALAAAGVHASLAGLGSLSPAELAGAGRVVIFASTFGDGDAPDAAGSFWQRLQGADAPRLDALSYAIAGFGDSTYADFCGFARKLDARLVELGATRLADRIDCDAGEEEKADAFAATLAATLGASPTAASPRAPAPAAARKSVHAARLVVNRRLNGAGSAKEVRQFGFDIADTGLAYTAGDALGVHPQNDPELVAEILAATGLSPEAPVAVDGAGEIPLAEALLRHLEIARPAPSFLAWWAARSGDRALAERVAGDKAQLGQFLWGRQLVDILAAAPAKVTAADFAGELKRLKPRLYSIASSAKADPGRVELTVSVVRYAHAGRARAGVASSFLADRLGEGTARLFVQPSSHFRVPADSDAPAIMVGPGTGIAPFRAFLQEREAAGARGRNWLFFGEQTQAHDFYYRDELHRWHERGHLTRLDTAFSRDQAQKVYVQDRMREQGAEIWRWLEEGGHFYVCGDAARMAKDVDAALLALVGTHGGLSPGDARAYVDALAGAHRYVRDVY